MNRRQDLEMLTDWQQAFLTRHQLSPEYVNHAQQWFDPLAEALVGHHNSAGRPVLVALNGSQGSGKSTLADYLVQGIRARYKLGAVSLSLDDFYYPREYRRALGQRIHPMLQTRGVPGTHDLGLLNAALDQLLDPDRTDPVAVPRFDKSVDDRSPESQRVETPIAVIVLEGWCLGVRPQPLDDLVEPVNALERDEDDEGLWRNHVNSVIARDLVPLYRRVDQWIMLQAPGFDCVYRWRLEQEQKLSAASASGGAQKRIMSAQEIADFIQCYQRLTEVCLKQLPEQVQHLFTLGDNRQVLQYRHQDVAP